jgi:hypothetical protein
MTNSFRELSPGFFDCEEVPIEGRGELGRNIVDVGRTGRLQFNPIRLKLASQAEDWGDAIRDRIEHRIELGVMVLAEVNFLVGL